MRCHWENRFEEGLTLAPMRSLNSEDCARNTEERLEGVEALILAAQVSETTQQQPPTHITLTLSRRVSYGGVQRRPSRPTRRPSHPSGYGEELQGRTPRAPRPVYTMEQDHSLLYYRDIVELPWKDVESELAKLYDENNRAIWPIRSESGLQSRYYRLIKMSAKERKALKKVGRYVSVLDSSNQRFWWMYSSNRRDFTEVERKFGRDYSNPQYARLMNMRQEMLRRGARRHRRDSSAERDVDMTSESEGSRSRFCSPAADSEAGSSELFYYKSASPEETRDDNRSLIDHSMEGLDDGSRQHRFRAFSCRL